MPRKQSQRHSAATPRSAPAPWLVGYADGDITPKPGQASMGGFAYERYAEGGGTPLRAQALAIRSLKGGAALLLCADIQGFDQTTVERLRRALGKKYKIPPEAILLAASHTHFGPGTLLRGNYLCCGPNPWYLVKLEAQLLSLADTALASLAPAELSYGALATAIGCNRRLKDDKGAIHFAPNPEGSYDRHTPIIHIERRGKAGPILLVGHACHPSSSGKIAGWSADYPGGLREQLENRLGHNTRALFVMGCGADAKVAHRDNVSGKTVFTADPVASQASGRLLADQVLNHLATQALIPLAGQLTCRMAGGFLTFNKPPARRTLEKMAYEGKPEHYATWWARQLLVSPDFPLRREWRVQAWRFGQQLTLIALEGEVCSPYGPLVRALARTPAAMIVAYANCTWAYIPTRQIYREGGYEGGDSFKAFLNPAPFTPKIEKEVMPIVKKALARLSTIG